MPEWPVVARVAGPLLHEVRVDDQPRGVGQHFAGEWEFVGTRFPRRRHAAVEHTVRE